MSDEDFAASLVRAGKRERMPAARKEALVASLGAGAGLAGAVGATKLAAPAKSVVSAVLAKWVTIGIATTALAVGTVKGADRLLAAPPPAITTREAPAVRTVPVTPAIVAPSVVEPEPPPVATMTAAPPVTASAPLRTRPPEPSAPEPSAPLPVRSVADEARLVERARTALAAGDPAAANTALDEHDRVYPHGAFADEARVVRIDLLARGDRPAAQAAAAEFLASHPASPYATHLRQLVGTN